MKQILKPFDYFFILKPVMFFPVWVLFLSGYYAQNKLIAPYLYSETNTSNGLAAIGEDKLIWVGLALTVLMGAIFVLNQVMARKSPETKSKVTLIAPGMLTPKSAFIESAILIVLAIGFGFFFSWKIGALALVILLLFGYLFNFSPFTWKDKPILALLAKLMTSFLIFGSGWFLNGELSSALVIQAVPYLGFFLSMLLFEAVEKAPSNDSQGESAFAEKFGFSTTLYVAVILTGASIAIAYTLNDELIFYPALFALPFFLWAAISAKNCEVERALKYAMVFLIIAISFKWGILFKDYLFIGTVAAIYFSAKIYYRLRFGLNYPTLAVETGEEKT